MYFNNFPLEIFNLSISEENKSLLKVQYSGNYCSGSFHMEQSCFFFFFFKGEKSLVEFIGDDIFLFWSDLKIPPFCCSSLLTHENRIQCPHFPSLSWGLDFTLWFLWYSIVAREFTVENRLYPIRSITW